MFISCNNFNTNIGVSCIKKNKNKISCHLAKKVNGKVELIDSDQEFPFSNPLITDSSERMFEFIIEANNLVYRLNKNI